MHFTAAPKKNSIQSPAEEECDSNQNHDPEVRALLHYPGPFVTILTPATLTEEPQ